MTKAHSYTSEVGLVKCQAEPAPDDRFAAIVILVSPIGTGRDLVRHACPGSDATARDAVLKARAWAESNYPPKPLAGARPTHDSALRAD